MKSARILLNKNEWLVLVACLAMVAALGATNYWIGWEYSFSVFYLLPIFICIHYIGRLSGLFVSVIAGSMWLFLDLYTNHYHRHYSDVLVGYWNGLALLGFLVIFSMLMSSVEEALVRQKGISRNLESLLTLAPYDEVGWDMSSEEPQTPLPGTAQKVDEAAPKS
jgi:hypothetical protein